MKWNIKNNILGDNCEEEAKRIFKKHMLFTKKELLISIELTINGIKKQRNITPAFRNKKIELYENFLSAIKNCSLPNLQPDNWRYYEYNYIGDGLVLEFCTADEIEFHDDELDCTSISDVKALLTVHSEFVNIETYASIQGVNEETVMQWINKGKLKSAKLENGVWLIPTVQDKPERGYFSSGYTIESEVHFDEFPLVALCDYVSIFRDSKNKSKYHCHLENHSHDFHEKMI